ncbi:MAG: hypothetical protein Hals2KO_33090 [Halioglobus sp.]
MSTVRTPFNRQTLPRLWALLTASMLLASLQVSALEVDSAWYQLNDEFEYLEDPTASIRIEDLISHPQDYVFTSSMNQRPKTVFAPVWLKLDLTFPPQTRDLQYHLTARMENMLDLRVYRFDADGNYSEFVTGNNYPARSRELDTPRYTFTVPSGLESTTVYVRMTGGAGSENLAWDLVEAELFDSQLRAYDLLTACSLAVIGALLFFNLLLGLNLRRREYLYYSGYVLFSFLALITLEGFGFLYLWPDRPSMNDHALHSLALASAMFLLMTVNAFLKTAQRAPVLYRVSLATLALLLIAIVGTSFFGISGLPPLVPFLPWLIGTAMVYVVCIHAIRQRVPLAWPLLLCMLVPSLAAVTQVVVTLQSPMTGMATMQFAKIGSTLHVLLFAVCLAAHIRYEMRARSEVLHDELTGLPGKLMLRERFDWMRNLAKRDVQTLTVLFVKLDGFKLVNESLGRTAGDELLRESAHRMSAQLRETDLLARLGADEFVVVLSSARGESPASDVARKLSEALSTPFSILERHVSIGASMGVASLTADGEDLDTLVEAAKSDMHTARTSAGNSPTLSKAISAT